MKNKYLIIILVALFYGCKKSNSSSNNTNPKTNPSLDDENYVIIDGVTYYHYSIWSPSVSCNNDMYIWTNINANQPNLGGNVMFFNNQVSVTALINGSLTSFGSFHSLWKSNVLAGKTVIEFNNLKLYVPKNGGPPMGKDTINAPYKLISGKFTCNGK